ncbi:MAG: hypothetical protein Q8P20_04670 [bacterium]|nr:hypothetical protein [bacterium]
MIEKKIIIIKSFIAGIVSIMMLAIFYFIVLTWVGGDWHHPWQQFLTVKYWMSLLFLGFGVQGGLFWYTKLVTKLKKAKQVAATNAGISTITMIACCAHHIVDFIPILGLSALTIFLAKYQAYFLAIGVMFNIFGIFYMSRIILKYKLFNINTIKI